MKPPPRSKAQPWSKELNRLLDYVEANKLTSANRGLAITRCASGVHIRLDNESRRATRPAPVMGGSSATNPLFIGRVIYFENAYGATGVDPADSANVVSVWNYAIQPLQVAAPKADEEPVGLCLEYLVRAATDVSWWRTAWAVDDSLGTSSVNASNATWAMNLVELTNPRIGTTVDMTTTPPTTTITYGDGVHGNGVDSAHLPGSMAMMPIPIGTIVACMTTTDSVQTYGPKPADVRTINRWIIGMPNGIDGSCS